MKINFVNQAPQKASVLVFLLAEGSKLTGALHILDRESRGHISRSLKAANMTGKRDQSVDILSPTSEHDRIFVFGIGKPDILTGKDIELMGGLIAGLLLGAKVRQATILAELPAIKDVSEAEGAALLASGARLRNYAFNKYKTKKADAPTELHALSIVTPKAAAARQEFAELDAVVEGVHLARNLISEPANILYPAEFSDRAKTLSRLDIKVEILAPAQMKKLGMGALLGVAQGSKFEPRVVVMRWDGGKKGQQPISFIGKGVTFDTGGVSIKPAAGMEDMKGDMGGAAAVTGLMLALAKRRAKCNVIGAIGLVENAIDGAAQRPGDIVRSMSGQTIAVLNTDAEGRLVLADVCWYIQDRFKPKFMVDLATLTGAIMVALGKEHAGLFSNNDQLSERLTAAGLATGERVWRLPLSPEYDKAIDSDVADMKNIGGRFAGAITGAQFIQRFVNKVPWAHLDIAGTSLDSVKNGISQSWGSGWGVRLLNRLVADHYEN